MFENYFAVIMAGGSGTRLWPLSRIDRPKQSIVISGKRTLFQHAVDRLEGLFPHERILVVTVAKQVDLLRGECPEIPLENFVIEPLPRGTASVVALAAIAIKHRAPQGVMAILTADHLIKNDAHLRQLLKAAYSSAQENFLVTLGITPDYPATGFGYIQKGDNVGEFHGLNAFHVKKFKEKPDLQRAQAMVSDRQHVWNSGMFIWKVQTILDEFGRQMPDLNNRMKEIDEAWESPERIATLKRIWPSILPQTIDYGIMENAGKVAVIPSVDLGWHDVGSWESLFDALETDQAGNILMGGETVAFDTQGTLICEESPDRLIVTVGVDDLVVIDTGKAVLVCDRKQTQRVRDVVNYLKESGRDRFL
ncbi:MAG: sugar phosphate nucleotidyltransferase [Chloroflexota bacterium]|nr:sugar phosphate nucleotidyltransferase [Chloroflexota bacterium]